MVIQYPYTLEKKVLQEAIQETNGNWQEQVETWVKVCNCRDEAGNGKTVQTADGTAYHYTALIQCPKGVEAIKVNTSIRVVDQDGNIRISGKVIFSRKDQLHSRQWL